MDCSCCKMGLDLQLSTFLWKGWSAEKFPEVEKGGPINRSGSCWFFLHLGWALAYGGI